MTYTCIAKKGVHEVQETGLNITQSIILESKYTKAGYEVEIIKEGKTKEPKLFTKSDLLEFYREHCLTTIEIGEKEVDNWMERRNGDG